MKFRSLTSFVALGALILGIVAVFWLQRGSVSANNVGAVSAGGDQTCALTAGGGVKCWGYNAYGELGNGTATNSSTLVDVTGLTSGVTAVSAGLFHNTCALATSGGVKCWGLNDFGQVGDSTTTNRSAPVDVWGLTNGVAAVSAGSSYNCALTTGGGLKCWGLDDFGQLGNDTIDYYSTTPVDVTGLTSGAAAVSAGGEHTCALTLGGGVKCWGHNNFGQLGNGTTNYGSTTAVDVPGLTSGVAAISAGRDYTCALTTGGGVKCWGDNTYGQLGDGQACGSSICASAVDVTGLASGVAAISAGLFHTCALVAGGGAKCWGDNTYGQLGDGTTTSSTTAVNVTDLASGANGVSVGDSHTCAATTGGGVKCWGYNAYGQLGNGTTADSANPVNVLGFGEGSDSDGDGCPNVRELVTGFGAQNSGGNRDPKNPWDYFNPTHDGKNRVDDILLVLHQFFKDSGNPAYNVDTDRTLLGPNAWNLGPPNGQQRVDDILNIVHQFFHDC